MLFIAKRQIAFFSLLILILLSLVSPAMAQNTNETTTQNSETENSFESPAPADNSTLNDLDTPDLPNDDFFASQPDEVTIQSNNPGKFSTLWAVVRMIVVLILIVALIYGVLFFMRKSMKLTPPTDDPFLRLVSQVSLGQGKSAEIITLLDKGYILGVSDSSINLIAEVTDKELVDAMNLYADDRDKKNKPRTFSDILKIFMPGGPTENNSSIYSSSKSKITDLLKKQKERLNDNDLSEVNL